jgi:hypothetical protein
MATHRSYSGEFKRQVVQDYLSGEALHGLAKRHFRPLRVSTGLLEVPRPMEPYAGPYGSPGPQVYSGTGPLPAPEPYSGAHAPSPYAPQVYSGWPGRMRWMIGPQPYGM